ncbi:hypothetical protein GCM10027612_63030 [Microbispora bryophytorum subsp. camponoti]
MKWPLLVLLAAGMITLLYDAARDIRRTNVRRPNPPQARCAASPPRSRTPAPVIPRKPPSPRRA